MSTSITSNPFPLGLITPVPGTPKTLTDNFPDFDCPYVNQIQIEAAPGNKGVCWFGNATLNVATRTGVLHVFMLPGDTLVLSNTAVNVYRLSDFLLDTEIAGDGLFVSVYVR